MWAAEGRVAVCSGLAGWGSCGLHRERMRWDINCDLGEGEPLVRTRALMRCVTSANVACGGHAGDVRIMERCALLAVRHGVRLGAHPGLQDGFGRAQAVVSVKDLETLLIQQVGGLQAVARGCRARLHHVKLHGSLYHAVEREAPLRRAFLRAMSRWFPGLKVYALAGGTVAAEAPRLGVDVWEEGFLDRAYRDDGTLVPRGETGALMTDARQRKVRLERLREGGGLLSAGGCPLSVRPRTLCVHGDSGEAIALARLARRLLVGG